MPGACGHILYPLCRCAVGDAASTILIPPALAGTFSLSAFLPAPAPAPEPPPAPVEAPPEPEKKPRKNGPDKGVTYIPWARPEPEVEPEMSIEDQILLLAQTP